MNQEREKWRGAHEARQLAARKRIEGGRQYYEKEDEEEQGNCD
jgi:hypothetical protein